MFEQQSYAFEAPAEPLREGDLFYKYEVGRWKFNNRIYAILAIAAVINLAFLGVLAQTNVLTARGCDSPFVGRVCQVLDMAYVGAMIYGTDREYVDAAYDKIDLDEAEVVWIDQTGVPAQLEYPEGYFQIANPEQYAQQQAALNGFEPDGFNSAGFPPVVPPVSSGSSLIDTPAITPKRNPKARPNDLPESPFDLSDVNGDPTADADSNKGKTNVDPGKKPNSDQTANANIQKPEPPISSDPVNEVDLNRRPLADLGNLVNDLIAKNELDITTPFIGNVEGKLTKEGRIDPKSLQIRIESSDDEMKQVVQEGVLAIDAAGFLKYLSMLSGRDLEMLLKQDDVAISGTVQSEMESELRAGTMRNLINLALTSQLEKKRNEPNPDQNDKDDLTLLEGAKVEAVGKKVVITFTIPKEIAHPMIQRKLAEQAAEMKKPNGNAMTKSNDNTAIR